MSKVFEGQCHVMSCCHLRQAHANIDLWITYGILWRACGANKWSKQHNHDLWRSKPIPHPLHRYEPAIPSADLRERIGKNKLFPNLPTVLVQTLRSALFHLQLCNFCNHVACGSEGLKHHHNLWLGTPPCPCHVENRWIKRITMHHSKKQKVRTTYANILLW